MACTWRCQTTTSRSWTLTLLLAHMARFYGQSVDVQAIIRVLESAVAGDVAGAALPALHHLVAALGGATSSRR